MEGARSERPDPAAILAPSNAVDCAVEGAREIMEGASMRRLRSRWQPVAESRAPRDESGDAGEDPYGDLSPELRRVLPSERSKQRASARKLAAASTAAPEQPAAYLAWRRGLMQWRAAAAAVWAAVGGVAVACVGQVALSPLNAPQFLGRLLSLSGLFALFCFALLQAAVASVRFRGVHVSPRVHSLVGALLRLALVPTNAIMLAAHVGAGLAGALCLLAFSGSEAPQVLARFEGEAHERIVFTTEAAFVLWGVCAFSLCFAAGGVLFGADLLRFPSLQRRRVPRFKQFLPTLLARAFGWATGFAAAWTAALAVTLFRASGSVSSRSVIDIVRPYGFTHADPLRVDALARLWLLCYLQSLSWEIVGALIQIIFTERARVPDEFLGHALADEQQPYARYIGLLALREAAGSEAGRTSLLGNDVRGAQWAEMRARCLNPLAAQTERLLACAERDEYFLFRFCPPLRDWNILTLSPRNLTRHVLADWQLFLWSAEAVSLMVESPLLEGAADGSVEEVLNVLVGFRDALIKYIRSDAFVPASLRNALHGREILRPETNALMASVEDAIRRVLARFYEYLPTFSFPPEYARIIQGFAEFAD